MVRSGPLFDNRCRPCVPAGEYPVRRPKRTAGQYNAVPVFRQLLNTASPGRSDRPGAPAQRRMMRLLSSASGSGAGTKSE